MANEKHDDLIREALERFQSSVDADKENREEAVDDLEFLTGRQWPDDVKDARAADGKPTLTINRMPQFVRQVTGDIRKTNPAIAISPADSRASDEMAEIFEGLVRNIEQSCDASSIYERAAEGAAACGLGHWRILTDYCDDTSFDQEIKIEAIPNPFAVHWDPNAKDPTRKDADYCFVTEMMTQDAFREAYPKAKLVEWQGDDTAHLANWSGEQKIQVAEYFWKERSAVTLYQLPDGSVVETLPEFVQPVNKRKSQSVKVMWAKMTGSEVLEGPVEMATRHIPIVSVVGEEINVGDQTVRTSVIRYAKDAQRMYNYWRSAQTELIALQPKSPFIGTKKQFAGHERDWETANTSNRPFLPYNSDPDAPGRPQREMPPMASQGMTQEVMLAADDMKATTGIHDAALGNSSNETSGVAIRQRQIESDISTSIYVDNLSKSIAHCGQIIVDMIPGIYDTTRMVRILGKDGEAQMVQINQPMESEYGLEMVNDPSVGKYDIRISTGPNYSTQRQEAVESMMGFVQAFPAAAPVIGDLLAKNMDWPGSDEIADRLKAMLPPGIGKPDDMSPEEQRAMQQQQQAQQAEQQRQAQMQQAMQEAEMRKAMAETAEAEADAKKAGFEAALKEMELAQTNGQMNAAIQNEVARVLASMQAPTMPLLGPQ